MIDISEKVKSYIANQGANLTGFASLCELPAENRWGYDYGISIAVAYKPEELSAISDIPNDKYYSAYKRLDKKLDEIAFMTERFLIDAGYKAMAITRENRDYNNEEKATRLPHKTVATRAGLGWIGKCALLITEEYGAGLRFISVLTDAPLEAGTPVNESRCGGCTECVDKCPGNAPAGANWKLGMVRENIFNAFVCRDYIAERGIKYNYGRTSVTCGLCILACPWTKRYIEKSN